MSAPINSAASIDTTPAGSILEPRCAIAKWLRQIDLLTRPKHSALPGLYIARYSPEPQSHVERINPACRPKRKLADAMLSRVAGGAKRNGVVIAGLHPDTIIGSGAHMRDF
jgi:hypothetical protein